MSLGFSSFFVFASRLWFLRFLNSYWITVECVPSFKDANRCFTYLHHFLFQLKVKNVERLLVTSSCVCNFCIDFDHNFSNFWKNMWGNCVHIRFGYIFSTSLAIISAGNCVQLQMDIISLDFWSYFLRKNTFFAGKIWLILDWSQKRRETFWRET